MVDSTGPSQREGVVRRRQVADFEASYTSTPPWDIDRPQPAFLALAESGAIRGRVLDVGCGTGEHALMASALGLSAVGVDAASTAITKAEVKARERNLSATFVVGDVLDLASLGEQPDVRLGLFDTVVDCGVFHVFDDADRGRYVASVAAVMPSGGRYFMLCFSEHQPGDWGPRRVTQDEIRASFAGGWQIDSIEPSRLVVTFLPEGVRAWLSAITKI